MYVVQASCPERIRNNSETTDRSNEQVSLCRAHRFQTWIEHGLNPNPNVIPNTRLTEYVKAKNHVSRINIAVVFRSRGKKETLTLFSFKLVERHWEETKKDDSLTRNDKGYELNATSNT